RDRRTTGAGCSDGRTHTHRLPRRGYDTGHSSSSHPISHQHPTTANPTTMNARYAPEAWSIIAPPRSNSPASATAIPPVQHPLSTDTSRHGTPPLNPPATGTGPTLQTSHRHPLLGFQCGLLQGCDNPVRNPGGVAVPAD